MYIAYQDRLKLRKNNSRICDLKCGQITATSQKVSFYFYITLFQSFRFFTNQLGRSPKVVARLSATNFSSYIIELLQLHDTIQIKWNYALIHYNIAIRSHLMILKDVWNLIFANKLGSIFLLHGKHSFGKAINGD